jgi:dTDP-6-deoxy-L-talose 4-dehydrogenase (NAD+)
VAPVVDAPPTIAVTGASGFIGRHVLTELGSRSISVAAVSRTTPETTVLQGHRLVIADLGHPPADLFEQMGSPSTLVHLAWGGLPNFRSATHLDDELPLQRAFLHTMIDAGVRHVVVAGTCLEYGMQSGQLDEEMPACPVVSYAKAKDELRRGLELAVKRGQHELTWARLFYTYGAGQAPKSLYSQLRAAVARGDATIDMSGGEQVRDYLPVEEVASALVDLTLLPGCGVVNVCSGRPTTVRDLVESWITENQWPIEPRYGVLPYVDYEAMAFWGDPTKLERVRTGA